MRHNNVQFNAKRASDKAKERLDAQFAKYLEVPLAEIKGEPIVSLPFSHIQDVFRVFAPF